MATPEFHRGAQKQAIPPGKPVGALDRPSRFDGFQGDGTGAERREVIDDAKDLFMRIEPALALEYGGKLVQDLKIDARALVPSKPMKPPSCDVPLFGVPGIVHVQQDVGIDEDLSDGHCARPPSASCRFP